MAYSHSALLFPYHQIPALADLRGPQWQQLVQRVSTLPEDDEETLSLCLLIIELCDCMGCDINSYKASLGCRTCARRAVAAQKGADLTLLRHFERVKAKLAAARASKDGKPALIKPRVAAHDAPEPEPAPARRRGRKPKAAPASSAE